MSSGRPLNKTLRILGDPVQIATAKAAAPVAPYDDGDLVSIAAACNLNGGKAPWGLVQITRQSGTVSLTGPVRLIGSCGGKIVDLGELKQGGTIAPDANLGFQELVFGAGLCDSLTILPAGVTGGGAYDAFYSAVGEL